MSPLDFRENTNEIASEIQSIDVQSIDILYGGGARIAHCVIVEIILVSPLSDSRQHHNTFPTNRAAAPD